MRKGKKVERGGEEKKVDWKREWREEKGGCVIDEKKMKW